ncbi:unnamed protein product [marine sediment metagenome]|uniref:Uncharacterized protein n=1 Tax=marine sediment metagenome TaxID=412755 RepID=X1ERQ4_9ZZZZ
MQSRVVIAPMPRGKMYQIIAGPKRIGPLILVRKIMKEAKG